MLKHDDLILILGITGTLGNALRRTLEHEGFKNIIGSTTNANLVSDEVFEFDCLLDSKLQRIANFLDAGAFTGKVALVINAIGVSGLVDLGKDKLHQTERIINLNLTFPISLQILMSRYVRSGGTVAHIGSMSGRISAPYFEVYGTSKHALRTFCRSYNSGIKPDIRAVHFEVGNFGGSMADEVLRQLDMGAIGDEAVTEKFRSIAMKRLAMSPDATQVAKTIVDILAKGKSKNSHLILPDAQVRFFIWLLGLSPIYRRLIVRLIKG